MTGVMRELRAKGQAEEDIYFAELDRKRIAELHRGNLDEPESSADGKGQALAGKYREELQRLAKTDRREHEALAQRVRALWGRIRHRRGESD